jgi:hypothetical protein
MCYGRLCGLVDGVPGYTSRGSVDDFLTHEFLKECVGLKRGPFSLMGITEDLLD